MTLVAAREALAVNRAADAPPGSAARTGRSAAPPVAMGQTAPLLQIAGVSLEYRTPERVVRATHRIDLDIYAADRFVLLGPSGCGKSTLLKAVAGFHEPVEGEIRLDGGVVRGPGPDRIVVFQEFDQLPPWKTVLQNVAFPLRAAGLAGRREAEARARHFIDKVGLSRFADSYPHQLSGGMKQRVAIARALATQPKVLLMDEPFAALDALTRRKMQEELLSLWEEVRFTLLFVTHSIEEALVVGSRVALLSPHPGRVRGEVNCHDFTLGDIGSRAFQAAVQRLHGRLFEASPEPETPSAPR
ncbi:sulfonate ABC transporter ATP-binding lipoprotein [Methylobacterium gregans]|uniref:Vitamin B12 import ATP-binding protein BtuD n=2 Tax=Methylobacterium gregans TaxID=374424 RepID=A0AA37HLZ1_9HYPH|nr:Vitamin B12 import ATP-binding protein BtuD [Methylobacterium gregans]GLS55569.1 sulfonate ABC transporter ATP-binding lipoprotein [Methylobacterium gregans]